MIYTKEKVFSAFLANGVSTDELDFQYDQFLNMLEDVETRPVNLDNPYWPVELDVTRLVRAILEAEDSYIDRNGNDRDLSGSVYWSKNQKRALVNFN